MTDSRSLETLTAADFRGVSGTLFRLVGDPARSGVSASVEVELVEVAESSPSGSGPYRTPFSLLFHGPLEPVLPQGIYRLESEPLDALELFIVPVGPDEPSAPGCKPRAMRYEAVFG